MTRRERVMAVLNRQKPDCIPFDMGGTDCSGVHVLPYQKLREIMGMKQGPVPCGCMSQLIAELEEDMRRALDVDVEALSFGSRETKVWKTPFGVDLIVPARFGVEDDVDGSSRVCDERGRVYARRAADAYYFDPVGTPLADITEVRALDQFDALFERWDYSSIYDEPLHDLAARARRQYQATDRAVVALWRLHYLQAGQLMRGYETFLMDLMVDKEIAHAFLGKLHQVYMKRVDTFLGAFGDAFDIVFLTDDLGTQQSGLISPSTYKEMIYPYTSELVRRIKAAGKKVVMHSCGAVAAFIPYLIEMGVDALNPVQVSAAGMNPRDLVREFGSDIAFWGGGCDTQNALNVSDLEVVRRDVQQRLEEFGDRASWVFTQVHNIQYDVPVANILAMREEFMVRTRS